MQIFEENYRLNRDCEYFSSASGRLTSRGDQVWWKRYLRLVTGLLVRQISSVFPKKFVLGVTKLSLFISLRQRSVDVASLLEITWPGSGLIRLITLRSVRLRLDRTRVPGSAYSLTFPREDSLLCIRTAFPGGTREEGNDFDAPAKAMSSLNQPDPKEFGNNCSDPGYFYQWGERLVEGRHKYFSRC